MKVFYKIIYMIICVFSFILVFSITAIATFKEKWNETLRHIEVAEYDVFGNIYKDIRYNENEECLYDLYLPQRKFYYTNYPLILFIHGGSFIGGDKSEGEEWCKFYAAKGCITASVNYTLHSKEKPSNIYRMHNDIKECVRCLKKDCDSLGYKVDEMAVTGISAGGCLAMLYAYKEGNNSPIPVKFVFQQTGPTIFHGKYWGADDKDSNMKFASLVTGIEISDSMYTSGRCQLLLDSISPACMVSNNSVPTICAYGPNDKIVPPEQKFILFTALDSCNVPYHYIEFPNSGHTLANDPDSMEVFIKRTNEFCKRYFKNSSSLTF